MSNEHISAALEKISATVTAQPEKARARNAAATAVLQDGLSFRVSGPNGEAAQSDMPKAMGGAASGPNPGWYLRAALASCTATAIAMRAARQGIVLTRLEMTVDSDSDVRGLLGLDDRISAALAGLRSRVVIGADNAKPEELRALVQWADAHS